MGRREYYKFDWRLLGFTIYVRKWNIIPKVLMENQQYFVLMEIVTKTNGKIITKTNANYENKC